MGKKEVGKWTKKMTEAVKLFPKMQVIKSRANRSLIRKTSLNSMHCVHPVRCRGGPHRLSELRHWYDRWPNQNPSRIQGWWRFTSLPGWSSARTGPRPPSSWIEQGNWEAQRTLWLPGGPASCSADRERSSIAPEFDRFGELYKPRPIDLLWGWS